MYINIIYNKAKKWIMDILSYIEGFEWDEWNIEKNWERHKVTNIECEEVFFNEPLIVTKDEPHSIVEVRYFVLGKTDKERLLFIVFIIRGKKIRIISARGMSKKERRIYYEQIKKDSQIHE